MEATAELKEFGRGLGFSAVGVCDASPPSGLGHLQNWLGAGFAGEMAYMASPLRRDLASLLPGVRSVIAVALDYYVPLAPTPGSARVARYAHGRDYHKVLRGKLRRLGRWLAARYSGAFRACVDSAPVLEREYAQRAGLGWFGKNTCLIDTRRGSWFFLGLLLSTIEFEPDGPAVGGCGTCTRCIDACPTGAIVRLDGVWSVDARRCISYLTIEKRGDLSADEERAIGDWTFGCDVCQEVCPFNTASAHVPGRGQTTLEADFLEGRRWPSLVELASISAERFDELTRGSAVRRAGVQGLRRNARANLANGGDVDRAATGGERSGQEQAADERVRG